MINSGNDPCAGKLSHCVFCQDVLCSGSKRLQLSDHSVATKSMSSRSLRERYCGPILTPLNEIDGHAMQQNKALRSLPVLLNRSQARANCSFSSSLRPLAVARRAQQRADLLNWTPTMIDPEASRLHNSREASPSGLQSQVHHKLAFAFPMSWYAVRW